MSPLRGSCFGFGVRSELRFEFLRGGDGARLEVDVHDENAPAEDEILVVEWKPQAGRAFHGRVYRQPGSAQFRLWSSDAGWFLVNPETGHISVPANTEPVAREARLWTTPMLLTFVHTGALALHAAAVEVDGRALVLGAPSQFGKTTLAAAFAARGYRLLAEDITCVTANGSGPLVVPGPSLLRLRPDAADSLKIPGTRVVATTRDRVFLTFEEELRGSSQPVPLGAILLLRGQEEKVTLQKAAGPELLRDLWALAFRLPSDEDTGRVFSGLTMLVDQAPIWDLRRPWDLTKLPMTVDQIIEALDE
jgi:hypothetical protein